MVGYTGATILENLYLSDVERPLGCPLNSSSQAIHVRDTSSAPQLVRTIWHLSWVAFNLEFRDHSSLAECR